jgi:erythromycin esterase-like protein
VTAAHEWDEPGLQRVVRPSLPGSWERMFHEAAAHSGAERLFVNLRDPLIAHALRGRRIQRAIGVIYRPETERASHYYEAELPRQFDAMIHIDVTTALEALEPHHLWRRGVEEPPEGYPSGL